jgi:hypothetical protein
MSAAYDEIPPSADPSSGVMLQNGEREIDALDEADPGGDTIVTLGWVVMAAVSGFCLGLLF